MSPTRGYYSLIQFCPDPARLEAANVGVVLFCPDLGFIKAKTARGNDRLRRFFRAESFDRRRVDAAKRAIVDRLNVEAERFKTPDDLRGFIDTRANDIVLTAPRPMRVSEEPEAELARLFKELVGGRAGRESRPRPFTKLDRLMHRPSLTGRVRFNEQVVIPVLGRSLEVPYAYQNGKLNLVKPQSFAEEGKALATAGRLALQGDLLQKHSEGAGRRLIVVPSFDKPERSADVRRRVEQLFGEYHIRVVPPESVEEFVAEVEREAHAPEVQDER